MGDVKLNDPLHLPTQVSPDADEAIRRDWAEANLAGGGGGITQAAADIRYVNETDHTKAAHDALDIDADTLDGIDSTGFASASHVGAGGTAHANAVAAGAAGFLTGTDKSKLDGIEANAKDNPSSSEIIGAFSGTPDGTKLLRDDGTLVVPASGYTPPWIKTGAGAIYTSWGDGNPFHVNRLLDAGLSPNRSNLNSVVSPGVLFRLPVNLALANIYAPTLQVATSGLHIAIYQQSNSALIASVNISSTLGGGWSPAAISGSLAKNTDYWLLYHGGVNTNTSAFLRTPNNPFDTWIYGSPSAPLGIYGSGIPLQIQVSVTTQGTWPDPMPAPSSFTPTNRGGMLALLEGTAS